MFLVTEVTANPTKTGKYRLCFDDLTTPYRYELIIAPAERIAYQPGSGFLYAEPLIQATCFNTSPQPPISDDPIHLLSPPFTQRFKVTGMDAIVVATQFLDYMADINPIAKAYLINWLTAAKHAFDAADEIIKVDEEE